MNHSKVYFIETYDEDGSLIELFSCTAKLLKEYIELEKLDQKSYKIYEGRLYKYHIHNHHETIKEKWRIEDSPFSDLSCILPDPDDNTKWMCDYTDQERYEAVKAIYYWQYSDDKTNFTSLLISMFQKADPTNLKRLRLGFEIYYQAFQQWKMANDNGNDLFRKYGFKIPFDQQEC